MTALRERFEAEPQEGDLPGAEPVRDVSRYIATVLNGLAVQSASGATEKELRLVMRRWHTSIRPT